MSSFRSKPCLEKIKHYKLNADEQRKVHITGVAYEVRARFSYNLKVFSIDNVKQIL